MKTTRNTLKKAVYQYLLDHTFPTKEGPTVSFILPKEQDFYRRILARERGYNRQSEAKVRRTWESFVLSQGYNQRHEKRVHKASRIGPLSVRMAIHIRRLLTKHINKYIYGNKKEGGKKAS